jgi:PPK2 family polyphosphate:nucleotide phosphotransferase
LEHRGGVYDAATVRFGRVRQCEGARMQITRVDGSLPVDLTEIDPDGTGDYHDKEAAQAALRGERDRIVALQERLYAEGRQSLLVVFQATDTGGKDGAIKKVFRGVNPQGCRVWGFGVPSEEERAHDALWRYHRRTPGKGMIGIFNRSHYEEVLVVRVKNLVAPGVWQGRYEEIREFEELLARNGTRILKFFLHISRDEQRERLQARLDDPEKHWKFRVGDLEDRKLWDDYQVAFQDAINRCATPQAPWYVVPANRKWYRNLAVARVIADTLEEMNPLWPEEEPGLDNVVIPE